MSRNTGFAALRNGDEIFPAMLKVIREEFDRGTEFAQKITYKAEGTVEIAVQEGAVVFRRPGAADG